MKQSEKWREKEREKEERLPVWTTTALGPVNSEQKIEEHLCRRRTLVRTSVCQCSSSSDLWHWLRFVSQRKRLFVLVLLSDHLKWRFCTHSHCSSLLLFELWNNDKPNQIATVTTFSDSAETQLGPLFLLCFSVCSFIRTLLRHQSFFNSFQQLLCFIALL